MNNIDLIPNAYRTRRWQARWLRTAAVLLASLSVAFGMGLAMLNTATVSAKARVEALQVKQTVTAQQRVDLERLNAQRTELEQQFELLSGLRSGAAAEDMFVAIDRALTSDDLWFLEWKFERAGVMVGEGVRTVNTGYFIVVPDGANPPADDAFRVQTNMMIRGQSRDHSALSSFVRNLFAQPEIDDVRIRRTSANRNGEINTVDFELGVVLKTVARDQ